MTNKFVRCVVVSLILTVFVLNVRSRAAERELTPELIKELQSSISVDPAMKALINAVSNNDLKKLSFNNEFHREHDNLFNFKVKAS